MKSLWQPTTPRNGLPAWAPLKVIVGHGPESINFKSLSDRVTAFYSGSHPDSERWQLIDEFQAKFVFWGPGEKELGNWSPIGKPFLNQVYNQNGYQIFEWGPH